MADYIRGNRPNGFYVTSNGSGMRIEGETRQCVHCQFIWQYKMGSGRRYGVCPHCDGLVCARAECLADQKKKLEDLNLGNRYHCLPFAHYNFILMERAGKLANTFGKLGVDFAIDEGGNLMLPTPKKETTGSPLILTP